MPKATILVGTAGYSYRDWIGPFYPEGTRATQMLEYYAREFSFTEINATYYQMPSQKMTAGLVKKTPAAFKFAIKAHQNLTHKPGGAGEDELKLFLAGLEPLAAAEKLAAILFQFPYAFKNSEQNRQYLLQLAEGCRPFPAAMEFRHRSWAQPAVKDFLTAAGVGYVCVDEPPLRGLLPPQDWVTAETAYLRFHGRNTAKWWRHNEAYERYDYLYTAAELDEWLPRVAEMLKVGRVLLVSFNNHFQAQAVENARMFKKMLEEKSG